MAEVLHIYSELKELPPMYSTNVSFCIGVKLPHEVSVGQLLKSFSWLVRNSPFTEIKTKWKIVSSIRNNDSNI